MVKLVREAKESFNGFINYFTTNNIDVFKYFSASGSIAWGNPLSLLNYSNEERSLSSQWASMYNDLVVTFTFKCPIYLTHYRLRARIDDRNENFLLSWKVEGSSDESNWNILDTKTNREELNALGKAATFACDSPMKVKNI